MQKYHPPQKKCTRDRAIQKRAAMFVFTILLFSAVSAAMGLLQGQRLAVEGEYLINNSLAAADTACVGAGCEQNTSDTPQEKTTETPTKKTDSKTAECKTGKEESCRNMCSTTYININGTKPETKDCYGEGGDVSSALIKALVACINDNNSGMKTTEQEMKEAMCITDAKVTVEESGAVSVKDTTTSTLSVPQKCQSIVQDIQESASKEGVVKKATTEEAQKCAWKGAAVCYPTGFKVTSTFPPKITMSGYECCAKADPKCTEVSMISAITSAITGGATQGPGGFMQKMQESIGKLGGLGKGFLSGLGKSLLKAFGGSGSGSSSGGNDNKEGKAPTCSITANETNIAQGESVTLKWRTTNARKVDVAPFKSDAALNANATVRPLITTAYTLTAYPNSSKTKSCTAEVTITVAEGETQTGTYPPKLSCTPQILQPGESADITFACMTNANGSVGENIETDNVVSGTVTVSPDTGTTYEVSCTKDDVVIGTSSCRIGIGEPLMDIVAHQQEASRGERVRVSWLSLFMKSCTVTGPRGFSYTTDKGVVITEPFSRDATLSPNKDIRAAIYTLVCESIFGKTITKDVSVDFVE